MLSGLYAQLFYVYKSKSHQAFLPYCHISGRTNFFLSAHIIHVVKSTNDYVVDCNP